MEVDEQIIGVRLCFSGGVWSKGDDGWTVERRYWRRRLADDVRRHGWHWQKAATPLSKP